MLRVVCMMHVFEMEMKTCTEIVCEVKRKEAKNKFVRFLFNKPNGSETEAKRFRFASFRFEAKTARPNTSDMMVFSSFTGLFSEALEE